MVRESGSAVVRPGRRAAAPLAPPVHPGLREVFAAFDEAKIAWTVLRGELDLDAPRGDTDLLVAEGDLDAARRVLVDAGWVEERSWGLKPHRAFLGFHAATGTWLKLDLVTECAFGKHAELRLSDADAILARGRKTGDVWLPAPADALWLLLLHALLDKGSVAERYRARLTELSAAAASSGDRGDPAVFVDSLGAAGWNAERILGAVARADWDGLDDAGPALRHAWASRNRARTRAVVAWRAIARRIGWRIGLIPRGLSVAILGPDGAGKSTLIQALQGAFPVPTRGIYMGLYKRQLKLLPGVGLIGRTLLQRIRYTRGRYHRARGRVVLFDRYTFDALVQEHTAPSWKKRIHTWLLAHAAPAPDLVLVLDISGDAMHARKGERDPATLERMRAGYRRIAERQGSESIDATMPAEQVARHATSSIWRTLAHGRKA